MRLVTQGIRIPGTEWMLRDKYYAERNFGAFQKIQKENLGPEFIALLKQLPKSKVVEIINGFKDGFNTNIVGKLWDERTSHGMSAIIRQKQFQKGKDKYEPLGEGSDS